MKRRDLAKAIPLIATLPSGRIMANASAYGCLIKLAEDPLPEPAVSDSDAFLRVVGAECLYTHGWMEETVYKLPDGTLRTSTGRLFNDTGWRLREENPINLLVMFEHDGGYTHVTAIGVWPDVQDGIAMNGSCLTSLAPGNVKDFA